MGLLTSQTLQERWWRASLRIVILFGHSLDDGNGACAHGAPISLHAGVTCVYLVPTTLFVYILDDCPCQDLIESLTVKGSYSLLDVNYFVKFLMLSLLPWKCVCLMLVPKLSMVCTISAPSLHHLRGNREVSAEHWKLGKLNLHTFLIKADIWQKHFVLNKSCLYKLCLFWCACSYTAVVCCTNVLGMPSVYEYLWYVFLVFNEQEAVSDKPFCWRNLFSCINLLRILQKLVKWKHSRTMVSSMWHITAPQYTPLQHHTPNVRGHVLPWHHTLLAVSTPLELSQNARSRCIKLIQHIGICQARVRGMLVSRNEFMVLSCIM